MSLLWHRIGKVKVQHQEIECELNTFLLRNSTEKLIQDLNVGIIDNFPI